MDLEWYRLGLMVYNWTHGIDFDSWLKLRVMVSTLTFGIVLLLLHQTHTRVQSVARMQDFFSWRFWFVFFLKLFLGFWVLSWQTNRRSQHYSISYQLKEAPTVHCNFTFHWHNFQKWDCCCQWAYFFGMGEVWWKYKVQKKMVYILLLSSTNCTVELDPLKFRTFRTHWAFRLYGIISEREGMDLFF